MAWRNLQDELLQAEIDRMRTENEKRKGYIPDRGIYGLPPTAESGAIARTPMAKGGAVKKPDYARPKANRRDYPKKYALGGYVAPGQGPLEVTGHSGPKEISYTDEFGEIRTTKNW